MNNSRQNLILAEARRAYNAGINIGRDKVSQSEWAADNYTQGDPYGVCFTPAGSDFLPSEIEEAFAIRVLDRLAGYPSEVAGDNPAKFYVSTSYAYDGGSIKGFDTREEAQAEYDSATGADSRAIIEGWLRAGGVDNS